MGTTAEATTCEETVHQCNCQGTILINLLFLGVYDNCSNLYNVLYFLCFVKSN
jgi:hypothetical protein